MVRDGVGAPPSLLGDSDMGCLETLAVQGRTYLAMGDHVHRALPDDVPRCAFVSLAEHCRGNGSIQQLKRGSPKHPSSAPPILSSQPRRTQRVLRSPPSLVHEETSGASTLMAKASAILPGLGTFSWGTGQPCTARGTHDTHTRCLLSGATRTSAQTPAPASPAARGSPAIRVTPARS